MQREIINQTYSLDEILSRKDDILWEIRDIHTQFLCDLPTIGGGHPKGKIKEYTGHFDDGTPIKVSTRSMIFFSIDTFLNLSPKYKGPWEWIYIQIGEYPNERLYYSSIEDENYGKMHELFKHARKNYRKHRQ